MLYYYYYLLSTIYELNYFFQACEFYLWLVIFYLIQLVKINADLRSRWIGFTAFFHSFTISDCEDYRHFRFPLVVHVSKTLDLALINFRNYRFNDIWSCEFFLLVIMAIVRRLSPLNYYWICLIIISYKIMDPVNGYF